MKLRERAELREPFFANLSCTDPSTASVPTPKDAVDG